MRVTLPGPPASCPRSPLVQEVAQPPRAEAPDARSAWLAHEVIPHEAVLRRWLRGRVPHDLEADDVVQDTYAALVAIAAVEHIEAPRSYMFRIAQSVISRHRRRGRIATFEPLVFTPAADLPSPEQEVAAREELRGALRAIRQLPERCRQAFALRRLEGLSQREVAHRMGISENTVEKHVGRALTAMADRRSLYLGAADQALAG